MEATPAPPVAGAGAGVDVVRALVPAATEPPPGPADDFAQTLREAEGLSLVPYPDTGGVIHICYGHRLPIDVPGCDALLVEDIDTAVAAAARVVGEPTWSGLTERRRNVLAEMAYMLGARRFRLFDLMLTALRAGDYERAAGEIKASLLRPPTRAARLANAMREG